MLIKIGDRGAFKVSLRARLNTKIDRVRRRRRAAHSPIRSATASRSQVRSLERHRRTAGIGVTEVLDRDLKPHPASRHRHVGQPASVAAAGPRRYRPTLCADDGRTCRAYSERHEPPWNRRTLPRTAKQYFKLLGKARLSPRYKRDPDNYLGFLSRGQSGTTTVNPLG